ncbi:hypothetical protein [Acidipropionibacterium jensenii]|uniref:hypothetical protein n=1 Tax=Acidipropionibacterium jensenii TaxID=1749 RepID=UPI002649D95E|nr:hypothetical protein [Acidipropionibacterium jensenii]MDN5997007.1 hypothetical protein [Acidipropionibacterium jensenii]MDN6426146.1 hypothetical protein [Acidipropionibacterium jensenii]MDN6442000.1 hypothetical protein [Acidipropionibacterium jensenii]MDN6480797.1 hypothetical protein [Acidipropionibacterium jensenii]MDN6511793.1 hypothetical protein [Acidipropionibacterium jensenii]
MTVFAPRPPLRWPRVLVVLLSGCLLAAGCQPGTLENPQTTRPSMSPSSTVSASASPFQGSATRLIVNELVEAAGGAPVTKVDVTSRQVNVTTRSRATAQIWTWQAGRITSSPAQSAQTVSRPFSPDDFALDRISQILETAGRAVGSRRNQELQILEYNQGVVLISVSTRPETAPAFFRPDGSFIATVDFTTTQGMTEALRDAVDTSTQVLSISYQPGKGLIVDTRTGTDGIVLRRTRPASLPAWAMERRGDTGASVFSPSDVSPAVLAGLMNQIPVTLNKTTDKSALSFTIDMSDGRPQPTIHFNLDGQTSVTDMAGKDITQQVR